MEEDCFVPQHDCTRHSPKPSAKHRRELPPLILHPIAGHGETLEAGSPSDSEDRRAAIRRLELKMLCCLGKDLNRWMEQCLEFAAGDPNLGQLREGDLIDLLVEDPPENVSRKMQTWGIADFRVVFARALGLNTVFPDPPAREDITESFLRDFAVYAYVLYRARRQALPPAAPRRRVRFEVYASGEYARLLERSWGL